MSQRRVGEGMLRYGQHDMAVREAAVRHCRLLASAWGDAIPAAELTRGFMVGDQRVHLVAWSRGIFKPEVLTDGPLTLLSSLADTYDDEHLEHDVMAYDYAPAGSNELAQTVRLGLASRSITATKEEPYKTVFYKGLAYYTAAPIRENAKRYRDLAERLSSALPAGHALLALVPQIHAAAAAFEASAAAVDEARNKVGLARTQLEAAEDAWARTLEKTYGALISEYGKAKAERFFPSLGKRDEVTSDDDAPPVSPPPA